MAYCAYMAPPSGTHTNGVISRVNLSLYHQISY